MDLTPRNPLICLADRPCFDYFIPNRVEIGDDKVG
jgi:hypothetical protein